MHDALYTIHHALTTLYTTVQVLAEQEAMGGQGAFLTIRVA
jgi:hypothetical protein